MGKLFYELESIPADITAAEYEAMLLKFYDSQPVNKVYRDIHRFNLAVLDRTKQDIFLKIAKNFFGEGPNQRDLTSLLNKQN
ncbi:MAG: hypothetical protein FWG68_08975 [Defluviitaleaceae bacterium]|nr:hypothetical protein [Defluviitaleaceae bacterium]